MRFFYCIHPRYCKTWVHYHASVRLCPLRVDINIKVAHSTCFRLLRCGGARWRLCPWAALAKDLNALLSWAAPPPWRRHRIVGPRVPWPAWTTGDPSRHSY